MECVSSAEDVVLRKRIIRLEEHGFRVASRGRRSSPSGPLNPYSDITHIVVAPRAISVGMRRDTLLLRRRHFDVPEGPERLAWQLVQGILRQPGGDAQWRRIQEVDRRLESPAPRVATTSVVAACIVVMIYQFLDPFASDVGAFVPELVARGEWWRVASGNLVHSLALFPFHILSNIILILGFALLVERPLGPVRTLLVMAAAGVGAMGSSALAGYEEVVGASGLAAGLVGAELCLELRFADRLPASWRLSRPLFITVLVLQVGFDLSIPFVAAAAHLGGFAAGFLAAGILAPSAFGEKPASPRLRWGAAAVVVAVGISLLGSLPLLLRDGDALARHARSVLSIPERHPVRDNDLAWRMVTESRLSPGQVAVAVELAERAVDGTERSNPDVLDTLAETLFALGDRSGALEAIDEAIALSADENYFVEQRRRFNGERAEDDRPTPPFLPWGLRRPPPPEMESEIEYRGGVEI